MLTYKHSPGLNDKPNAAMLLPRAKPLLHRWIFALVKVDSWFLLPYTAEARGRIEREGGYGSGFSAFLDRFLEALAAPEWAPGTYYPGGWYRQLEAAGSDPAKAEFSPAELARFYQEEFRIEAGGEWRVGRKRIEDPVRRFFLRNLHFDPALERYLIRYPLDSHHETRYIHHHSPPLRVVRINFGGGGGGGGTVTLNDGTSEPLRTETLRLDAEEHLFCAVRADGLPALFEDNARWQLLDKVEELPSGRFVLMRDEREIVLDLHAPAEFPGGTFLPES